MYVWISDVKINFIKITKRFMNLLNSWQFHEIVSKILIHLFYFHSNKLFFLMFYLVSYELCLCDYLNFRKLLTEFYSLLELYSAVDFDQNYLHCFKHTVAVVKYLLFSWLSFYSTCVCCAYLSTHCHIHTCM